MQGVLAVVVLVMQLLQPLQCLAGYYHIKYGHLFDTNYKLGVSENPMSTCRGRLGSGHATIALLHPDSIKLVAQ